MGALSLCEWVGVGGGRGEGGGGRGGDIDTTLNRPTHEVALFSSHVMSSH